jgi:AcrR family transcriptional regulator
MRLVSRIDDALLDAVARILGRAGVPGLNISAVAEEAGISRVTLHRRGTSVEDLVVAVLGRASDDLRAALLPVLAGPGVAAARLDAALHVLCEVAERHAGVLTALFGFEPRPLPGRPGRTTSFEFIEPFERLLVDGRQDGTLRAADPRADATLVANAVCWTYLHMRQAHRWAPAVAADRAIAMACAGLQP